MTACGWTVGKCPCGDYDALVDEVAVDVEAWAVELLWKQSGSIYGPCPVAVRPCRNDCWPRSGALTTPVRIGGSWVNIGCTRCPGDCSCSLVSEVKLPGPVGAVVEILVDGVTLDPPEDHVRVDDYSRVVRIDGGRWPACQHLDAPPTDAGTWQITYNRGLPVPPGGESVAAILACELAKACAGSGDCRLPKRIQTVTRQGMTVGFLDSFDMLDEGRFGLFEVDSWLASARRAAGGRRRRGRSPDVPRQRMQTWPDPLAGLSP